MNCDAAEMRSIGADRCRYHHRIRPSRKLLHGEKAVKKSVTPLLFKGDGACDQRLDDITFIENEWHETLGGP